VPANLTPDYFKAEEWFRKATSNEEKILALEQMLATIPKHKGTEHLQADIKRRLSKLKEAPAQKAGARHTDIFHVPKTGAGQVVLLGTPNCGKSSIVAALTNAKVNVADFPFATTAPVPGMVHFEDVQIQLVDTPPITADYSMPGQVGAYRHCDLIAIVIDLSADVVEQLRICLDFLETRRLLTDDATGKKVICICTKSDIARPDVLQTLRQSCKYPFEFIEISVKTGTGLGELPAIFFRLLNVIRIYAKPPGKPVDKKEPFVVPAGSTVTDLAGVVHKGLAEKLKFAKIWGDNTYPGQNVHHTHVLHDKDIIELHFS
jgi:hypothetical protein